MNLGNMTLLEGQPQASTLCSDFTVSAGRGAALNPEASVFCLPNSNPKSRENHRNDRVYPFMNGDVAKESCGGDCCPTSDPPVCCNTDQMDEPIIEISSTPDKGIEANSLQERVTDNSIANEMQEQLKEEPSSENIDSLLEHQQINGETISQSQSIPVNTESSESTSVDIPNKQVEENGAEQMAGEPTKVSHEATPVVNSVEPMTRDQIKELVGQHVEYFFSRENWSSDPYLLSQMDSDQYVPVYILANCSQFKSITKDHSIILDALKDSLYVQLDEENNRVRPNYKRCIVILREIPKSTPVKEIEAMFEGEGCPKSLSCEFVHNDFWYVTFESDSDAQKAYRYLRETVKTFKGKPILARIKTKPMSRLGCLSVLPSYAGKPPGDARDGVIPTPSPAPCLPPVGASGMTGVPNPPPPSAYPPGNAQRVFFPPQNNMNPSYPNYNYSGSAQISAAYFYPNPMMQWASPPNFYDINGFIQYNGLSPRAAFKPQTNTRFPSSNNNNNRRNKNRDNKYEKSDSRHMNVGSNNNNTNGGAQNRHNQVGSRPQSAHSPHPSSQTGVVNPSSHHSLINQHQPAQPSSSLKGDCQNVSSSNCATPNNTNNNGSSVHQSQDSFAQNDLSLASQSTLYTSFSPPAGGTPRGSVVKVDKKEKGDSVNSITTNVTSTTTTTVVQNHLVSSSLETPGAPSPESLSSSCSSYSASVPSNSVAPPIVSSHNHSVNQNSFGHIQHSPQSHAPQQPPQQLQQPHHHHQSVPSSLRNNYNEAHPSNRDLQPQRQMSRGGGRRRIPRRDEDANGHSNSGGNGRNSQRGPASQSSNVDPHSKNSHMELKKPQFELQATSFPPLPSAEEIAAAIPEEKAPIEVAPPPQVAWSGEPQKFSDVMKGTAKPKPSHSINEKESSHDNAVSPQSNNASLIVEPISVKISSSSLAPSQPPISSNHDASTSSTNSACTNSIKSPATEAPHTTASLSVNAATTSRPERVPGRDRHTREERRGVGSQPVRRDRDYVPGIGRGGIRRDRDRENGSFRLNGNKENRPQGASHRSWREERPDPDGWITKNSRESRSQRDHRYQHSSHQHSFYENRNSTSANNKTAHPMVNGDSSPPTSPKPDVERKHTVNINNHSSQKVATINNKNNISNLESKPAKEESIREKTINNNDGEHKTSWAKMALASKDQMERLSAELKEKEELERAKKIRTTRPQPKLPERAPVGREREGNKPFRRENFPPRERERERERDVVGRDFRGSDRSSSYSIRPRDPIRPKSPK